MLVHAPRPKIDPRAWGCACDECPLARRRRPVAPEGPADADLVLVGEAPHAQCELKGRPFQGPGGLILKEVLQAAGAPSRERIWLTYAILCRPDVPNLSGKKRFELKTYMAWLRMENRKRQRDAKKQGIPYTPVRSPLDCCRPRLLAELAHFERVALARGQPAGAIVIPTGNYSLSAVANKAGIGKWRGSPLPMAVPTK